MNLMGDTIVFKKSSLLAMFCTSGLILAISIGFLFDKTIASAANYSIAQSPNNNEQLTRELYLEKCAICHIPIPAEVLPTATWQKILENPNDHYGKSLPRYNRINTLLLWQYLRAYSRPLIQGEQIPQYLKDSRYFKALHPQVNLPQAIGHQSCLACHPGAKQLDYRTLSGEFQ
jgi:hypothetical protein